MFPRWPLSAEIKVQTCSVFEKCLWCLRYSPALSVRSGSRGELRISSSVLFQVYDELLKRYAQLEERVVQKSHSWASNRHQWNPATAIFYWSQLWVWLLHLFTWKKIRVITGTLSHLKMGCSLRLQPDWINDIIIMSKPDWRIALTQHRVILYGQADLLSPPAVKEKRS